MLIDIRSAGDIFGDMRVSRDQAQRNRKHSIEVASRLFRERGYNGAGVAELMKAAGFTHGAFYGQFASKGDLVEQASAAALAEGTSKLENVTQDQAHPFAALLDYYLSPKHRDLIPQGCTLAALSADAAREPDSVRALFTHSIGEHLAIVRKALAPAAPEEIEEKSIAALSTMVGALLLARATHDEQLSRRILDSAKSSLLEMLNEQA